jgi:hypothetical protein
MERQPVERSKKLRRQTTQASMRSAGIREMKIS